MRVVYDDEMQGVMIQAVEEYLNTLQVKKILGPDKKVRTYMLRDGLNKFFERYHMSIGNTVTHAHGIGANYQYPVYYHPENSIEIQQCGSINFVTGFYGEAYMNCEDYNQQRVSDAYMITRRGVKITEKKGGGR